MSNKQNRSKSDGSKPQSRGRSNKPKLTTNSWKPTRAIQPSVWQPTPIGNFVYPSSSGFYNPKPSRFKEIRSRFKVNFESFFTSLININLRLFWSVGTIFIISLICIMYYDYNNNHSGFLGNILKYLDKFDVLHPFVKQIEEHYQKMFALTIFAWIPISCGLRKLHYLLFGIVWVLVSVDHSLWLYWFEAWSLLMYIKMDNRFRYYTVSLVLLPFIIYLSVYHYPVGKAATENHGNLI